MKNYAMAAIRIGLAITFLWIGVLIYREPETWGGFIQPWAAALLPVPLKTAMIGAAILDIAIGFFLLLNWFVFWASLLAFSHIALVLAVAGIDSITVRDIGLAGAALGLLLDSWPVRLRELFLHS